MTICVNCPKADGVLLSSHAGGAGPLNLKSVYTDWPWAQGDRTRTVGNSLPSHVHTKLQDTYVFSGKDLLADLTGLRRELGLAARQTGCSWAPCEAPRIAVRYAQ